jgi:hypothetical protein
MFHVWDELLVSVRYPPLHHAPLNRVITHLALISNYMYHVISPSSPCLEKKTSVSVSSAVQGDLCLPWAKQSHG